MEVAFIGVGVDGGRIVESVLADERRAGTAVVAAALALADDEAAFDALELVPQANRLLVAVPGSADGSDPAERGAAAVRDAQGEVVEALTGLATSPVDALFVVADLADGTAGGGAAALARLLGRLFEAPVFGLAVLPPAAVDPAGARSAARSLATLDREADGVLLVDPGVWTDPDGPDLAATVAARVGLLLRVGSGDEWGAVDRLEPEAVVEALAVGGAAALGVADDRLGSANDDDDGDDGDDGEPPAADEGPDADRVAALVDAALGDLSLDCEVAGAGSALVVLAAPPAFLDGSVVAAARRRLAAVVDNREVRVGGFPTPSADRITAVVLVAGLSEAPRLVALREAAVAAGSDRGGDASEGE